MTEKKYKCPFCGYEMDKKLNRCENCASILDINIQPEDETTSALDLTNKKVEEQPEINAEEKAEEQPEMKSEEKEEVKIEEEAVETSRERTEETLTNSEKTQSGAKGNSSIYGDTFINQPYNAYNKINNLNPPVSKPLTNGMKVALTTLCVLLPVIGQFIGLVLSIIYMNSDEELKDCDDRRSFGLALLIACVIAFVLSAFGGFLLLIFIAANTI